MSENMIGRRRLLTRAVAGAGGLLLTGCDRIGAVPAFRDLLFSAEGLTLHAQRLVTDRHALAREFTRADLSPVFKANGSLAPDTPDYVRLSSTGFADYRLRIDGLVARRPDPPACTTSDHPPRLC
jgi:DMSO/TMAO reductase YedYZ molybdopterin-dependent catalytic subunit